MPFSEAVKLVVKQKAAFRCCRCHEIGVDIHHIVPESLNGPNQVENAAPLCQNCHSRFGGNPEKRKEITQMRDWWYEVVAERYRGDSVSLQAINDLVVRIQKTQEGQTAVLRVSDILSDSNVDYIDRAVREGRGLEAIESEFRVRGQHAVGDYVAALQDLSRGSDPRSTEKWLTELLERSSSDSTKRILLERRAELRGCRLGNPLAGLQDIDDALQMTPLSETRIQVQLLRQALNQCYVAIPQTDVLEPARWVQLRTYLGRALDIMELGSQDDATRMHRAVRFSAIAGPGVLIFEALIRAAEMRDSPRHCRKSLQWHLCLIEAMKKAEPRVGWNRYTPLAAQAIALGELELAAEVLRRAESDAMSGGTDPVSVYARKQRDQDGAEWLLHNLLRSVLLLAQAKTRKSGVGNAERQARRLLRDICHPKNHVRARPFLRAAALYDRESSRGRNDQDRLVGAFNVPARSYWTYLPKLPAH